MESNGRPHCIHLSEETAELLRKAGKQHWIKQREDKIVAKGKGALQTYWLNMGTLNTTSSYTSGGSATKKKEDIILDSALDVSEQIAVVAAAEQAAKASVPAPEISCSQEKTDRLIKWNTDVLVRLMKQIVARRRFTGSRKNAQSPSETDLKTVPGPSLLDLVASSVTLMDTGFTSVDVDMIDIDPAVIQQIEDYVRCISVLYNDHPYNSFERASHVTMSCAKFLSRIIRSHDSNKEDHTFAITSDPLTQFS
jgi:hypothetical protein